MLLLSKMDSRQIWATPKELWPSLQTRSKPWSSSSSRAGTIQACLDVGVEYWKVKLANKTRWNSTVESFKSVKKIKPALDHLGATDNTGEWGSRVLTAVEYRWMDDVIEVLEPFRDSTKIFESEKEPTVQRVVPELYNMTDKLNKFSNSPDKHVAAFAKALLKSLNERMPDNRTGVQRYLCLFESFPTSALITGFGVKIVILASVTKFHTLK